VRALGCTKKNRKDSYALSLLGEGWGEGWRRAVKQSLFPDPSPKREKGERQLGFHFT
jgi:hypothetical protein